LANARRLALLAAGLWLAASPALAAAVAFVTDVRGVVRSAGAPAVGLLAELPAGARLSLDPGASLTVIYVASGTEFTLSGPGEFVLDPAGAKAASGAAPARRTVPSRPDPVVVTRLAESATASVRMRSAPSPKASSSRPALVYPRSTQVATLQPTLAWIANVPAGGFTVVVADESGKPAWQGKAQSTSARVGSRLEPAARYTWTLFDGSTSLGEARFETLPAEAIRRAEVSRAAARTFSGRILHALVLHDIGADQDARQAWSELARERPDLPELAILAR